MKFEVVGSMPRKLKKFYGAFLEKLKLSNRP